MLVSIMLLSVSSPVSASTATPFKFFTKGKNVLVWQRFGDWLMITEDLAAGRVCYYYSSTTRTKLNLKEAMTGEWIPLGSAIKWLAYVDHIDGLDRLVSHDVDSQVWHITKSSTLNQVGCGMVGNICYFGEYRDDAINGITPVDLYTVDVSSGEILLMCASDTQKSQFAHDGNLLVYKAQYPSGITGICGRYFGGTGEFLIRQCDAYEPSVCADMVAWAQQSGDDWLIMGMDLSTGEVRQVALTSADDPHPEAGRNTIFWQDARNYSSTGIDIYGYDWQSGEEFVVTNATGDQYNLRVCDDLVTWVSGLTNYQIFWGAWLKPAEEISDLRAERINGTDIDLAWTAIGTTSNPVTSYEVRISDQAAITDDNWDQASSACTVATSADPGAEVNASFSVTEYGVYYAAVRAEFTTGEHSSVSNCIMLAASAGSADVLKYQQGAYIGFSGTVTGVSPDNSFYLQHDGGVLCVRVVPAAGQSSAAVGEIVTATGILGQDERYYGPVIWRAAITGQTSGGSVRRFAMSNKSLGGCNADLTGASNIWLPVRVWGRVSGLSASSGCSFVISDGSLAGGVQVVSPFAAPSDLADGAMVCVNGICTVSRLDGRIVEVVQEESTK